MFNDDELAILADLVRDGFLEVVTEQDFMNPYIRPWPTRRSGEDQAADVLGFGSRPGRQQIVCLYPTSEALRDQPPGDLWPSEPYRQRLALGRSQLDLGYFTVDVIEQYRNDPRYHFWASDFEVYFGISDDAYLNKDEAERDKITSMRVGFAYDVTTIKSDKVRRFACSFMTDLAGLTPEHQQRWRTYEVEPDGNMNPHPVWWGMMMGRWADGIGP